MEDRSFEMKKRKGRIATVLAIAVFGTMFIVGAMSPEVGVVFKKAVNICLECIGIGG